MFSEFHLLLCTMMLVFGICFQVCGTWFRKLSFVKCFYIDFFIASHGASLLKFTLAVNHDTSMHAGHTCTVAFSLLSRSCAVSVLTHHRRSALRMNGSRKRSTSYCVNRTPSHVTFSRVCPHSTRHWLKVLVRVIPSMCHAPVCLIALRPSLRTLHLSPPSSTSSS